MIIVMGKIRAAASDIESLYDAMATQMATTQAEDGCELYVFSRDVTDPNVILISERWRDGEALAAHSKAPHMATFNRAIGGIKIEEISVKAYDVSGVRTLIGE
ncbi:MAG: antibiotic biosynthesis monooxygenase [Alphaproteobacteria bacterium]|jgi:quinol monooxygenase YgiN|nr:antibiotic biosynthesis monooxygenase [Alphaproteobacteria bacterium]